MNLLSKNLVEILRRKDWNQADLAEKSGVDSATINRVIKGKVKLTSDSLPAIADALGVSVSQLLAEGLSFDPNVVLEKSKGRRIPVLDYAQVLSLPEAMKTASEDQTKDFILTYGDYSKMTFAMRIHGDSMVPTFREGDVIIVDPDAKPKPGEYVIAEVPPKKEAVLLQYRESGINESGEQVFELVPDNPIYASVRSDRQPVRIIGTVDKHTKNMRRK